MKFGKHLILCFSDNDTQFHSISSNCLVCTFDPSGYVSKFDFPKLLKSQNRVFGCSQKFSNACSHHGCSGTRRSESSSSWPGWWRSSVEAPATQPAASGTDVGHPWEGGCCSWLCDPSHSRGSQSGWDRDCMLATPFCWRQTAAGSRWPPLTCGGERCHPGRQPSVLSAAV